MRDWVAGTRAGDWVSMGVPSDGSYGIPEGVIYGYPVTCEGGKYEIVQGLENNDFAGQDRRDAQGAAGRARRDRAPAQVNQKPGTYHIFQRSKSRPVSHDFAL